MTQVPAGDRPGGGVIGTGGVLVVENRAESQLATLRFRLKDVAMEAAEEAFERRRAEGPRGLADRQRRPACATASTRPRASWA